ncbi:MAG: beta-propeller domain-containing protein [Candidatus Geothermincolia bacterium]
MNKQVTIFLAILLAVLLAVGVGVGTYYSLRPGTEAGHQPRTSMLKFETAGDFLEAFKAGLKSQRGYAEDGMMMKSLSPTAPAASGSASEQKAEHSNTNVQVEGVDEADVVKNDGKYIYAISGNQVFIVNAYPAQGAGVVAKIDFSNRSTPSELFIDRDKLVVIGSSYFDNTASFKESGFMPPRGGLVFAEVFDIKDKAAPKLVRNIEYEGTYSTARMIDHNVHIICTTYPYQILYDQKEPTVSDIIPRYRDTLNNADPGKFELVGSYRDIEVVDPKQFTSYLSVISFPLNGDGQNLNKRVIAGYSDNVYASLSNLYLASSQYQYYWNMDPNYTGDTEKTTVYKFKFDGPKTTFLTSAEVPGTVLNQFSMDESGGNFRIATTVGQVSREGASSTNNVYILDDSMNPAGKLEGLAPGEKIYSARFMGNRAYMVTFKKVDPFFVLDLSDPANPRVLGELKIPGYSDYLHPYDENHVIGIGKDTEEAGPEEGGNFAWYQGMKVAIFDVTDLAHPREMHKVVIGDRGTDSYALSDHKAFLFDRTKNLLVLPVRLAELTPEQKASPNHQSNDYGQVTFQGAYVYNITLDGGIQLRGRITHADNSAEINKNSYYYGGSSDITRSLWIGDSLYTVSPSKIKANSLADLAEQASITLSVNPQPVEGR